MNLRILFLILLLPNSLLGAKTAKPLEPDELAGLPTFKDVTVEAADWAKRISPDGEWIVYVAQDFRRVREPIHTGRFSGSNALEANAAADLWLVAAAGGEPRCLTGGQGTNFKPVWSPDGTQIAFVSTRDGAARLWLWEMASGALRRVSEQIVRMDSALDSLRWSPDGRMLLTTAEKPRLAPSGRLAEGSSVRVFRSDDAAESIIPPGEAALCDVASGAMQRIGGEMAAAVFAPRSGRLAAFVVKPSADRDSPSVAMAVQIFDASGASRTAGELPLDLRALPPAWSADGTFLAWLNRGQCWIAAASGGPTRALFPKPRPELGKVRAFFWHEDGAALFAFADGKLYRIGVADGTLAVTATGPGNNALLFPGQSAANGPLAARGECVAAAAIGANRLRFFSASLKPGGASAPMREIGASDSFPRQVRELEVSADGASVAFIAQDAEHPDDLWLVRSGEPKARRLTTLAPAFEGRALGHQRVLRYQDHEGKERRGLLTLPPGHEAGRRYPTLVHVYPDRTGGDFASFFGGDGLAGVDNRQLFATRGYVVLEPDLAGSGERPAAALAPLTLAAVDAAIAEGIADPEHLGLFGHSNGGFAVIALLTQTDRFKAAIARAGFANLTSRHGALDAAGAAYGLRAEKASASATLVGQLSQKRDAFTAESPIFALDRVKTPLLLIHGSYDSAVPCEQSEEVFVGLRELGRKVEYARYEREQHRERYWMHSNQLDLLRRTLSWWDQHLPTR